MKLADFNSSLALLGAATKDRTAKEGPSRDFPDEKPPKPSGAGTGTGTGTGATPPPGAAPPPGTVAVPPSGSVVLPPNTTTVIMPRTTGLVLLGAGAITKPPKTSSSAPASTPDTEKPPSQELGTKKPPSQEIIDAKVTPSDEGGSQGGGYTPPPAIVTDEGPSLVPNQGPSPVASKRSVLVPVFVGGAVGYVVAKKSGAVIGAAAGYLYAKRSP